MDEDLVAKIDAALARIRPMARASFAPALSIERQLEWCRGYVREHATDDRPGPLSMGLIAVREFDMHGDQPDLSDLVNEIQRHVEARLKEA